MAAKRKHRVTNASHELQEAAKRHAFAKLLGGRDTAAGLLAAAENYGRALLEDRFLSERAERGPNLRDVVEAEARGETFVCDDCHGKVFLSRFAYAAHRAIHKKGHKNGKNSKPAGTETPRTEPRPCKRGCGKTFTWPAAKGRHEAVCKGKK